MKRTTPVFVLSALLAVALVVSCGTGEADKAPAANSADIKFAQEMIPHHEQALDMAKLVAERSDNVQVRDLAEAIEQAQDPEIEAMSGWLEAWNAEMPSHEGHREMAGMMSGDDMAALANAAGPEFDRMWLRMMIEHHEGAIEMAKTELANGSNADAKRLASEIIVAQQAEIDTMTALLD